MHVAWLSVPILDAASHPRRRFQGRQANVQRPLQVGPDQHAKEGWCVHGMLWALTVKSVVVARSVHLM